MSLTSTQRSRNRRRVERGARWLDEVDPGWENTIDLSVLDMAQPCWCVLGQIVKEVKPNEDFFTVVADDEGLEDYERQNHLRYVEESAGETLRPLVMTSDLAVERGFQVDFNNDANGGDDDLINEIFNNLTRQWRRQINKRKGA